MRFVFENDEERVVDLDEYLHGPVFEPLRQDRELWNSMRVELGAITWPNGADKAPETIYIDRGPGRASEA